jgi:hypothetical protein
LQPGTDAQAAFNAIKDIIIKDLPPGETIASAENNSTTPPTPLTVGGQLGGSIKIRMDPPLSQTQKTALADAVSHDSALPRDLVKTVVAGPSARPAASSTTVTINENAIIDTPTAQAISPDQMPNSGLYAAPGSLGAINSDTERNISWVYFLSENPDGTIQPFIVTAPTSDPLAATPVIEEKIRKIVGNVGLNSINQAVLDALQGGISDALQTALRALNKIVNQLKATDSSKIDEAVRAKTANLVASLNNVISQVTAAISDVNGSVA